MVHPKLRRALAASILASAVALIPAGSADAAVRARAPRDRGVSARLEIAASWLKAAAAEVLQKMGVRIDPDGHS